MEERGVNNRLFFKNPRSIVFAYNDETPPEKWKPLTKLRLIRPATGVATNFWYYRDIEKKYQKVKEGRELWTAQWKRSQTECIHGKACKRSNCEVGKAVQTIHIVSGQFVALWGFLGSCLPRGKQLRLVQVSVEESGEKEVKSGEKEEKEKSGEKEVKVKEEKEKVKEEKEPLTITGVRILSGSIDGLREKLKMMEEEQKQAGRGESEK